jgi:4-amino-4-deoxy-L-arabinose transferase-like glycosyltransferase
MGLAMIFWVSLGAGVLTKGPVAPAVILLTAAALVISSRSARWILQLRPGVGGLLFVLVVVPWPLAMLSAHGSEFFVHAWRADLWPKIATGQESHGAPPFYYLLLLPLAF